LGGGCRRLAPTFGCEGKKEEDEDEEVRPCYNLFHYLFLYLKLNLKALRIFI
jgi:hypothetical protein